MGTSWRGWRRVEWDWHMRMSYLTSLNPQLFENIAYVGSFKYFLFNLFYMYFATCPSLTAVTKRMRASLLQVCSNWEWITKVLMWQCIMGNISCAVNWQWLHQMVFLAFAHFLTMGRCQNSAQIKLKSIRRVLSTPAYLEVEYIRKYGWERRGLLSKNSKKRRRKNVFLYPRGTW